MPIRSTAGQTLARIDELINKLENSNHRAMLKAFKQHWRGEVTGDLDSSFDNLPKNSHFAVMGALTAGEAFEVNTAAEHRAIYQRMLDLGLNPGGAFSDERFAFADWGMMMETVYSNVVYGSMLANVGDYKSEELYLIHMPMVMVCFFSPTGQMLGKRDYMATPSSIEPADSETLQRLIAL